MAFQDIKSQQVYSVGFVLQAVGSDQPADVCTMARPTRERKYVSQCCESISNPDPCMLGPSTVIPTSALVWTLCPGRWEMASGCSFAVAQWLVNNIDPGQCCHCCVSLALPSWPDTAQLTPHVSRWVQKERYRQNVCTNAVPNQINFVDSPPRLAH